MPRITCFTTVHFFADGETNGDVTGRDDEVSQRFSSLVLLVFRGRWDFFVLRDREAVLGGVQHVQDLLGKL